ncbi:EAL domain-containing protein [Neptunomonas antarctica]|uniref:EAL domain, c-di-GMP-specific phosphodiesterase class I (Or its enzymatically inactive variant) n=1 Tax=Neptunomonas antarctica TaxID=619304 RepID=A0A1N7LPC0_9GAMM|nr:EAL domain-containing protein [Neptunomonas antarctica]SIS75604.1 EAL domain, c-di-GMP-specific phosphodiesterase class I (or its enzymatically inactive variant) [Neptunomonas antarctica]
MTNSDLFEFVNESNTSDSHSVSLPAWKILSVEDDQNYQDTLLYSLRDLKVMQRPLQVLTANSATGAAAVLARHNDINVILLDVVMETDDAGLRLVDTIREVLGDSVVRIILLTGQPGMIPRQDVMQRYDIDEYWCKSDLTSDKLQTIVASHIRTYQSIYELHQARKGLMMVVDAARAITSKQNLVEFGHTVLEEIGRIIGVSCGGGILCAADNNNDDPLQAEVIATSGTYGEFDGSIEGFLAQGCDTKADIVSAALRKAVATEQHQFYPGFNVLYFDTSALDHHRQRYMMIVDSEQPLDKNNLNLLKVFSENIRSGFTNVALTNRLGDLAYKDQELQIHNRNWLLRELNIMKTTERSSGIMIMVDVKHCKEMEITIGNIHARQLLTQLCQNLMLACPQCYAIARTDDHSFALLTHNNAPDEECLNKLADQCINIDGLDHYLHLTVARVDLELLAEEEAERIVHLAEAVIYQAGQQHKRVMSYQPVMLEQITSRHQLLRELQVAIQNRDMFLVLQPKVHLVSRQVVGFEALLRWQRPDGSFVPPDQFIPLAETSGLISRIDTEVLEMTFVAIEALQAAGIALPISFNATCADLMNGQYVATIFNAVSSGRIDPVLLDIEITESQAMEDYEKINPLLHRFVELGMGVSIDDFGTGYSSLAHVTKLSATTLKVDRSFVSAMLDEDQAGSHVVDMVLQLGEKFGFMIVAEGIETETECEQLIGKGCLQGQGYLFAKPMPLNVLIDWLKPELSCA